MPPSSLQDGSKTPQDRNLTPTWAQLGPTWPHLGPILATKISISCGRGCIFALFDDKRLKQCKVTSRWPREAPKTPQERPKSPQGGPKTAPRGSKMAPRWPQDGLKTAKFHPSSLQVASKLASSRPCSTKLPPSRRQDGSSWQLGSTWPHLGPTWPHLGPPSCLQDGPKTPQDSNLTPTWAQLRTIFNIKISIPSGRGRIF